MEGNLKKIISLKIYHLHFLSNLFKIFTEVELVNFKRIECSNLLIIKIKFLLKKITYFFSCSLSKNLVF